MRKKEREREKKIIVPPMASENFVDGFKTRFWLNDWVDRQSLANIFPGLFTISDQ